MKTLFARFSRSCQYFSITLSVVLMLLTSIEMHAQEFNDPQQSPGETYEQYVNRVVAYRQGFVAKGVVVYNLWGRSGQAGGISDNTYELRSALANYGVPGENVTVQGWNNSCPDCAGIRPRIFETALHVKSIINNQGRQIPSYLAIVGHSFGGWASSWLSLLLSRDSALLGSPAFIMAMAEDPISASAWDAQPMPPYLPDYVTLFDPVFHGNYPMKAAAKDGVNYFQDIAVTELDWCWVQKGDCGIVGLDELSCGSRVDGIRNQKEVFKKEVNGEAMKWQCPWGSEIKRRETHTSIDDSPYLKMLVRERIISDVRGLLEKTKNDVYQQYYTDKVSSYWRSVRLTSISSFDSNSYSQQILSGQKTLEQVYHDIRQRAIWYAYEQAFGIITNTVNNEDYFQAILLNGHNWEDVYFRFVSSKKYKEIFGLTLSPSLESDRNIMEESFAFLKPDAFLLVSREPALKANFLDDAVEAIYLRVLNRNATVDEIRQVRVRIEQSKPGFLATNTPVSVDLAVVEQELTKWRDLVVTTTIVVNSILLN